MSTKHSWCSSNSSHDWHLFSLLATYNSPMNANKANPQPVPCSHMMDDLLREFQSLFCFLKPSTRTPSLHTKHTFNTSISCAQAQRWDRYAHTYLHKFPRWRRKHQTSGSMFEKNKVCQEDCVSVLSSYLKEWCEMASQQRGLLLRWQCLRFWSTFFGLLVVTEELHCWMMMIALWTVFLWITVSWRSRKKGRAFSQ